MNRGTFTIVVAVMGMIGIFVGIGVGFKHRTPLKSWSDVLANTLVDKLGTVICVDNALEYREQVTLSNAAGASFRVFDLHHTEDIPSNASCGILDIDPKLEHQNDLVIQLEHDTGLDLSFWDCGPAPPDKTESLEQKCTKLQMDGATALIKLEVDGLKKVHTTKAVRFPAPSN